MNKKGKIFSLIAVSGAMLFSFAFVGKNINFSGVKALNGEAKNPNKTVTFEGTPTLISSGSTSRYSKLAVSDENTPIYLILDTVVNPGDNPIAFGSSSTKSSFYFSKYQNGKNGENKDEPYAFRNVNSIYFDGLNRSFFVDAYKYTSGSYETIVDSSMPSTVSTMGTKSIEVNKKLSHRFDCRGQSVYEVFSPKVILTYVCDSSENPKQCTSISLSGEYQTTFYQYSTFNHDGLVVTANYSDGSTKDISSDTNVTFSGGSTSTIGLKTITVKYSCDEGEFVNSYQINVIPEAVTYHVSFTYNSEQGNIIMDTPTVFDYESGDIVGFTINPADGYEIDTVTSAQVFEIEHENNCYHFVMPNENVIIYVTFKEKQQPITFDIFKALNDLGSFRMSSSVDNQYIDNMTLSQNKSGTEKSVNGSRSTIWTFNYDATKINDTKYLLSVSNVVQGAKVSIGFAAGVKNLDSFIVELNNDVITSLTLVSTTSGVTYSFTYNC